MKQRIGAILCLILGTVLIGGGLGGAGGVTAGETVPTACGSGVSIGAVTNPGNCPTGSIDVTEVTDVSADPGAEPPASWSLSVSSVGATTCNLPASGTTIAVADGGTATFSGLFIYASSDPSDATTCEYAITETAVAGFASVFAPSAPYSFVYVPDRTAGTEVRRDALTGPSPLAVTVTNTAAAAPPTVVTTTPAPPTVVTTTAAPPTVVTSTSVAPSSSVSGSLIHESISVEPSSAAPIAATGPRRPIGTTVYLGVALLLLGTTLLLSGLPRRRARHRA